MTDIPPTSDVNVNDDANGSNSKELVRTDELLDDTKQKSGGDGDVPKELSEEGVKEDKHSKAAADEC